MEGVFWNSLPRLLSLVLVPSEESEGREIDDEQKRQHCGRSPYDESSAENDRDRKAEEENGGSEIAVTRHESPFLSGNVAVGLFVLLGAS